MNSFLVEMDASSMYSMNIPQKFAKMLKGSMSENVELEDPSGITWHVKMIRSNNKFALQSRWKDFATANGIDENDILVFKFKGNSSFKVKIFDRSGCQKAPPFIAKKMETETEHAQESNDSSIQEIAAPDREVEKEIISLSSGSSDTDESSHEISTRAAGARTTVDFVQESTESESSSRLYAVPQKTHLTKAQKEIADRIAKKTQKGSELMVKMLTTVNIHTNINCQVRFPNGFACKVLQSSKKKIILLPADIDERSKICTADYTKTKSKKRYISQGWRKFVCRNGLKQGDICLFELRKEVREGILTMIVHLIRE